MRSWLYGSMGNSNWIKFVLRATAAQPTLKPTLKLTWKTESPVWVSQWPLPMEKLFHLNDLIHEQLSAGHIVPTTSPWTPLVFVILKKSGKWWLLHDLQHIDSPKLASCNKWSERSIFLSIPLHPDDASKFPFFVPSINVSEPATRYHWVVLP